MRSNIVLSPIYNDALSFIERGQYERAAEFLLECESDQESYVLSIPLRNLVNFRLAIKANTIPLNGQHILDDRHIHDVEVKAETHLVNGIYYNSCRMFKKAQQSFIQASLSYKEIGWNEKYFICVYNAIISEVNESENLMTEDHIQKLITLQLEADRLQNKKILGLVCRQKSYFFKEKQRWNAALQEAENAVSYLEGRVFTSDYHLALLNLADCYIELQLVTKAKAALEKIFSPIDPRVQFAYEFIVKRLNQSWNEQTLKQMVISNEVDPHFLYRAQLTSDDSTLKRITETKDSERAYLWNKKEEMLQLSNQNWKLAPSSKEFYLLNLLVEGPKSAEYIMSVLWPLYSEKEQLENRLYTLISRVNKKFNGIIKHEKGKYSINGILKLG